MKLSHALVLALIKSGTDKVFGVSGANIEHLHDAINILGGSRLKSILAKCESGAAFMADGYARTNKKIGVCCATSGGGMVNLVAGIAESFQEGIPVLAIIGQSPRALQGKGAFQDSKGIGNTINAELLWRSVSKHVAVFEDKEDFWPKLAQAIKSCTNKRAGPSTLLIARDIFDEEVSDMPMNFLDQIKPDLPHDVPSDHELDQVVEALNHSSSPALIFGLGVKLSPWQDHAITLAKKLNVPVFTTLSSKCAFPNNSYQYFGTLGVAGHPSAHEYINKKADLILSLGTTHPLMMRGPIESGLLKNTIAVDVDVEATSRAIKVELAISCEPGIFCQKLLAKPLPRFELPTYERTIMRPKICEVSTDKNIKPNFSNMPIRQSEALGILGQYIPSYSHLVFDAGNCAAAALHYIDIPIGGTSTIALGMGGMGYAVGAAIGAQISAPQKTRTFAFLGDGAFLMAGLEIHTAFELGLPILFIVFNNNRHGMCVTRQKLFFDGRIEATTYTNLSVAKTVGGLALGKDIFLAEASNRSELIRALHDYDLVKNKPGVLELKLVIEENPPFTPFSAEKPEVISVKPNIKDSILAVIDEDLPKTRGQ